MIQDGLPLVLDLFFLCLSNMVPFVPLIGHDFSFVSLYMWHPYSWKPLPCPLHSMWWNVTYFQSSPEMYLFHYSPALHTDLVTVPVLIRQFLPLCITAQYAQYYSTTCSIRPRTKFLQTYVHLETGAWSWIQFSDFKLNLMSVTNWLFISPSKFMLKLQLSVWWYYEVKLLEDD